MTILVLGGTGQVGSHLRKLLPDASFLSREQADLLNPVRVEDAITAAKPSAIINAAAYTAVDRAESEPEAAWRINAETVAALARAANAVRASLIHLSTDYVFSGRSERPYREDDAADPLSVYGRTKLAGELAVASISNRYWILRTSWVFSEHGTNFAKTMLRLANERDSISIVADQFGRPTYAGDIARLIKALVISESNGTAPLSGTFHIGGGPTVSWYQFAMEIFEQASAKGLIRKRPTVTAIPTTDYPTPAPRPMNANLEPNQMLQNTLGVVPDWQAGLGRALDHLIDRRGQ